MTEPGKQHGFILRQGGAGDGGDHHGAAAAGFEREAEVGVCVREVQLQLRRCREQAVAEAAG